MKLQDQDIKAGRIEYETGSVEVEVAFTVLLFRPFRNEIIDAQVTTVTEVRHVCFDSRRLYLAIERPRCCCSVEYLSLTDLV